MDKLFLFLHELESRSIYYKLDKIRDSILVEIAVPGQRWEVEFFDDDHIEIEKFNSTGFIYGEDEIKNLFLNFTD